MVNDREGVGVSRSLRIEYPCTGTGDGSRITLFKQHVTNYLLDVQLKDEV